MKRLREDENDPNHNYKKTHLNYDPYFDSHNDSYTEYSYHFLPTHHKTNPRIAYIFELCEEIDNLKQSDSEREKLISLMELRKKEISLIHKTIKTETTDSGLGAELIFILGLF